MTDLKDGLNMMMSRAEMKRCFHSPKAKLITPIAWNRPGAIIENLPSCLPFNSGGT